MRGRLMQTHTQPCDSHRHSKCYMYKRFGRKSKSLRSWGHQTGIGLGAEKTTWWVKRVRT